MNATLRDRFVQVARQEVLVESLRRSELERVLRSLAAANVRSLLMKGRALAYLHESLAVTGALRVPWRARRLRVVSSTIGSRGRTVANLTAWA